MNKGTISTASTMGLLGSSTTGTSMYLDQWSNPQFIKSVEYPDSLEFIYKQYSLVSHGWNNKQDERVFKIVFSCVDGKWNKSEPIYGKVIPAQDEDYEFED